MRDSKLLDSPGVRENPAPRRLWEIAGPILMIGWAVGICYVCGMRGFFALDQSIVFDGAWRVLKGQVPYRDFLLPYGPMALWIQAAAFAWFGVSYRVYVLTAAVLNGVGAFLAYSIIRRLVPGRRWLALAAGFLTGTWLYAPMATTYPEQTGFLAVLASVTAVVMGVTGDRARCRWIWLTAAGMALGVAVLCKTNAGLFAVLAIPASVALMLRRPLRTVVGDWLALGTGIAIALAGFALWLWTKSDPAMFRFAVFQLAGQEGSGRLFGEGFQHVLAGMATGKGNDLVRIITLSAITLLTLGLAAALTGREPDAAKAARLRLLAVLALALVGYQNLFSLSSSNNGTNEVPFLGLIWAFAFEAFLIVRESRRDPNGWRGLGKPWCKGTLATAVLITVLMMPTSKNFDLVAGAAVALLIAWSGHWWEKAGSAQTAGPDRPGSWALGAFWVMLVSLWGLGIAVGYQRQIQEVFNSKTRYVRRESIPGLRGIRWAENVDAGEAHASWADFESVVRELQSNEGQFYVVGDYTILYGVVGRPSVGPLLWLHKGLTYPTEYDVNLDRRLAGAVDRPEVTRIVVENILFMDTHPLLDFPLLQDVVKNHYHRSAQYGLFTIYLRNQVGP